MNLRTSPEPSRVARVAHPPSNRRDGLWKPEAVAWFYEVSFDAMYSEARRTTGRDEQFCLDVVQDALLKALRCIRPLDDESSLAAWRRLLVRSVAYDRLRSESRRRGREERSAQSEAARDDLAHSEDEARMLWLQEQLQALDGDAARLIDLRYRLGWTLARIGETLGLKPGAVDGRIRRTLDRLRAAAEEATDEL